MAAILQSLGRNSFRHRRRVLALWLGVLILIAVIGAAVSKPFSEEFKIPGTGSQQAIDLLKAKLPSASGAAGQVVFAAPSRGQAKDARAAIESAVSAAGKTPGVVSITNPLETQGAISKDGRYALAQVQFEDERDMIKSSQRERLQETFAPVEKAGVEVEFGGAAGGEKAGA